MVDKERFSQLFKVGEVIQASTDPRKNTVPLKIKILSIEEHSARYQSLRSPRKCRLEYLHLQVLINNFEEINPKSIQKSINGILKKAGLKRDHVTESYQYAFAKVFRERANGAVFNEDIFLADGEEQTKSSFSEGSRIAVSVDRIERSQKARQKCISHYGAVCQVCCFNFEDVYGSIGRGYIHVHHHREQLAGRQGKHTVNPITDLIPLCPNCHAMVHIRKKMLSVDELRRAIADTASQETK